MITIVKRDAIKKEQSLREVAPKSARDALHKEHDWRKFALEGEVVTLDGKSRWRPKSRLQDPAEMRRQMKDYARQIERTDPVKIDASVRNQLWKKAKRLKDQFVIGMVPRDDMHPVSHRQIVQNGQLKTVVVADYDKLASSRAVERNHEWYQRNKDILAEFKRIMRILEPDNSSAGDYEKFRPKRRNA